MDEFIDDGIPSYMVAANNHNTGNQNEDFFTGEERSFGNRAYNMVGSAAISGINSFVNTAIWAGNLFSDEEAEYRKTEDVIAGFDEDMAQYYTENRETADLVGFVASSFVPGLGGVKVFQAGMKALNLAKGGTVTANMSKGLGIMPGSRAQLIKEASESFATSRLPFSYKSPEVMKAITSGYGQNILESLAFETAVAVTMKKSPILTDLDFGETVSNMMWGAGLGGAIGGSLAAVGAVNKIKSGIKAIDAKLHGVTQIDMGAAGTRASDSLLILRNDLDTTAVNAPDGVAQDLYSTVRKQKFETVENKSRTLFSELAGDDELGNTLYTAIAADDTAGFASKVLGLVGVRPLNALGKLTKKGNFEELGPPAHIDKGFERVWYKEGDTVATNTRKSGDTHWYDTPVGTVSPSATGGAKVTGPTHSMKFLRLWGDDMGKLSDEAPAARHLADYGKITVKAGGVIAGDVMYKFQKGLVDMGKVTYEEAMARNIWAMDPDVPKLALKKSQTHIDIHQNDTAMLTKAYREGFRDFRVVADDGTALLTSPESDTLLNFLARQKDSLTKAEMKKIVAGNAKLTAEHVANRFDTPMGFLTGEQYPADMSKAIFGLANAQQKWFDKFHANTARPPELSTVTPWKRAQNYGMVYDNATPGTIDGFQVDAMATIRARQEVYKAAAENAAASSLGNKHALLPGITEAELQKVNRTGAGPGFISYSNSDLGSIGQKFEFIGSLVTKWVGEARDKIGTTFNAVNYGIINSPKDAAALAVILQKVRGAGAHKYVMDDSGELLILKSVRDYKRALEEGLEAVPPVIPAHVDEMIEFGSGKVKNWVRTHIDANATRVRSKNDLRTAQGYEASWDPEIMYAPQPNPDRFKYHAFVVDESKIVSQGDTTMLYATDAVGLEKQMAQARANGFNVYTPDQAADYYKARGLYDYSLSLSESQIDNSLRAGGSSAPQFPLTGSPQEMIQDIMEWHGKQEAGLIRESVDTKYWREFGIIRQMGKEYEQVSNAQVGFFNKVTRKTENPYDNYMKLAHGINPKGNHPTWQTLNDFVEKVGSKAYEAVSNVWRNEKAPFNVDEVNKVFDNYGIKLPATKAQMDAWVNHPAGTKAVSELVQTSNAVLSSLILRLDPINALNNAVSSPILTLTEANSMLRNAFAGNERLAGELAKLIDLGVPGTSDTIRSPMKLMGKAMSNFWGDGSTELLEKYRSLNVVSDVSNQMKYLVETATITGTETAAELAAKSRKVIELGKKLVDKGEKWTGNRWAEEFNRFVSANMMDQITAPLVREGLMDAKTANVYINTFVNRTQGNIIASQRPQMFQGPLGQAIGLFQSYQFNFMQQMLRYVGEGSKKDAIMLMGLQGSIFGMNGLPAFQAINQHIIGNASGNTSHKDAYTSVNNAVGKNVGDWLMYGAASNLLLDPDLKINLYSRGDISPRQLTVVPTTFDQIPSYAAAAKLYGSMKGAVSNLQNGGDVWNTMLGGIEQQGLNRPLAGMARVARGFTNDGVSYSATGSGNIISANELMSFANLARLSGAKPFDEAIAQDAMFRFQAYNARDTTLRSNLGSAIKTVITGGGTPTDEQMNGFMENYVKIGGKQEEFSKWYMQQVRAATTPQVNKMFTSNKTSQAEYMQSIMGGRMLKTPENVLLQMQQQQDMQ